MSAIGVADIDGLIGVEQYEEEGEFPVEQGYVWTTLLLGRERQPPVLGRRGGRRGDRRPDRPAHHGLGVVPAPPLGPGPDHQGLPLQVHFDLKEGLGLPEAVMSDNTIVFHEPVRPGDRLTTRQILRSVSDEKTTKLGHRPLLGHRRRVPQPARRAGGRRELHRLRLPAAGPDADAEAAS